MGRPSTTPKRPTTPPQQMEHVIDFHEHRKIEEACRVTDLLYRYGLCEKVIAHETGLGIRQVRQITSACMVRLGVKSRLQVALKLAGVLEEWRPKV